MCGRNSDSHRLLCASRRCRDVEAEVILDIEAVVAPNVEIGDESISNT